MFKKIHPLLIVIICYVMAHSLLLINHGIYWDDWTLYNVDPSDLMNQFIGNGVIYVGYLHNFLISLTPNVGLLYHAIVFTSFLIAIVAFYYTVKKLKWGENAPFVMSLIFALVPIFTARVTMICLPYTLGLMLQSVSLYLFVRAVYDRSIVCRILTLIVQFLAFMALNSTLPFWLGVVLLFAMQQTQIKSLNLNSIKKLLLQGLKWADFVIIPFVFWFVRLLYWMPDAKMVYAAEGYNKVGIKALIIAPFNFIWGFILNTYHIAESSLETLSTQPKLLVVSICFGIIFLITKRLNATQDPKSTISWKKILYIGLLVFVLAEAAYVLVGKMPSNFSFESRHQILLFFAYPILFYSLYTAIQSEKAKKYTLMIVVSILITVNIYSNIFYITQAQKMDAIALNFKNNPLPYGSNVVSYDKSGVCNEKYVICFYEYQGLNKLSDNSKSHLIEDVIESIGSYPYLDIIVKEEQYNMSNASRFDQHDYILLLSPSKGGGYSLVDKLKGILYYFTDRSQYNNHISKICDFKLVKTCNE